MKSTLVLAALGALAFAAPVAAAELLTNGDFEATGFGGTGGYYNLGNVGADHPVPADFGWAVPVNNVDIVANGVYGPYLASGGAYSLDLVGYGATGGISQTFNTVAGKTYTVKFDYSSNNGIDNPTADVSVDGGSIGGVTGSHSWQSFTTTFVGTGAATTFAITEVYGGGNAGVFLDNVSVSGAVPEPASWALMITGLGLACAALRRRSAKALAA